MSLSYLLVVTGPPYGTQQASSAYLFAKALVKSRHCLNSVFFYQEGIYNANKFTLPATDEFDLVRGWHKLGIKHNIMLNVCISAAMRRGVVDELSMANLQQGFLLTGLGSLAEAMLICDRTIQF